MTAEVGDRRATHRPLEAPVEGDLGVDELVGEPRRAPQAHLAEGTLGDQLGEQAHRGQAPVVEPDGVAHAGRAHRGQSGGRVLGRHGEGLLAQNVLAGTRRRDGDLGVGARRGADVDDIDIGAFDQRPPVGHRLDAHARGDLPHPVGVTARHGDGDERGLRRTDQWSGSVGVGVRATHHPVADDADAALAHGVGPTSDDAVAATRSAATASCTDAPVIAAPRA